MVLMLMSDALALNIAKKRWEKNNNWEGYSRWLRRTSILIPLPPASYERIPTIIKRTILLEFPIYVFDPAKHSDIAAEKESSIRMVISRRIIGIQDMPCRSRDHWLVDRDNLH